MKRKSRVLLLCVILLVAACAGGQPDIYEQPEQNVEDDSASVPAALPLQEEPKPEEAAATEEPQVYDADEAPEPSLTPEEIRELLESIPYAGMSGRGPSDWVEEYSVANSEVAREMLHFISGVIGLGTLPSVSFNSPEEANFVFLFNASSWQTQWLYLGGHPELNALVPYVDPSTDRLMLHSHIEETAKMLFGQELAIRPFIDSAGMFRTYEWLGTYAYWLAAFGIPASMIPIILSYEYIGEAYEVACVFVWSFDNRYYPTGFNEPIAEDRDALLAYLRTTTEIHTITLKRNAAGRFYYWAHILPGD